MPVARLRESRVMAADEMNDAAARDEALSEEAEQTDGQNEGTAGGGANGGDTNVAAALAERDKYLEMARRARADFDNYQKRMARDLQQERKYAAQSLVADMLPVLENLQRAVDASKGAAESGGKLLEGITLVQRQWLDVFQKHGVNPIEPTGEMFDPNLHEAVMQQPSADHPPMTVLNTVRIGYQYHDRVVRPAQVIVARTPDE